MTREEAEKVSAELVAKAEADACIAAARIMLATLQAIKELTDTGEPDWNDAIGDRARYAIAVARAAGIGGEP